VPFLSVFAYIALDCCPKPSFFLHPLTTNHQSLRSFRYNHSFQTFSHSSKASITSVFFHHHNIIHSKCLGTWQPSSTLTSSLAQHHITSHHIINLQQACESPTSAKCLQLWPRSLHGKPPSLSHSSFTDICQKPKKKPPSLPPNSSELLDRGERHCWRMDTQGTAWWGWVSGHRHHHFWALVITWCGRTEHLCMRPTIVRHIPFNSHAGGFARSSGQT
jgi:hypothetical protein